VACSRSVGTVPGTAPGGRRSSSVLISVKVFIGLWDGSGVGGIARPLMADTAKPLLIAPAAAALLVTGTSALANIVDGSDQICVPLWGGGVYRSAEVG